MLLTACESDADKLTRLNGDRAVNCLLSEKYQREYEMVSLQKPSHLKDSLTLQSVAWNTKCELAERELNRFMR
jgi:hypothetical protein